MKHMNVKDVNFKVDLRYQISRVLGKGTYGTVCSAVDYRSVNNRGDYLMVAIKKVTNIFREEVLLKRAVRELKLMGHFRGHRNVRSHSYPSLGKHCHIIYLLI